MIVNYTRVLEDASSLLRYAACSGRKWVSDQLHLLELACNAVGYPTTIRVSPGAVFISRALDLWVDQKGAGSTSPGRESLRTTLP